MKEFTRRIDENFPVTWHEFTSKLGKKYTIGDIQDEYKEIVTNHMVYGLGKDEPLCKYSYATTFPSFLLPSMQAWRGVINQNLSLVCLTTNDNGEIQIAGANCLYIASEDEKSDFENEEKTSTSKILETYQFMGKMADPFKKLGVNEYLSGMGLYVLPEFRGEGIGVELLKAREPFCRSIGLKATCTVFTSIFSQIAATKAGFDDLYTIRYEDLAKKENLIFPGIEEHTETIKFMYKVYN